ncbi:helix-hairpin-helix domain-containing protein [Alteromonas gilva]|uniref:Helix-hairpin-helix domain-containing protein n=1 Tax=Alteromonas gilva TaxID=2987522 RepID=A0ABT5KZZ4_9ALTE|nr:helix-hairpin-helix domain-containing protein [Alteromonas gilva]MDC8829826.1 helix-hairpin-helix domain-containing protein [Alteromonas gilva]
MIKLIIAIALIAGVVYLLNRSRRYGESSEEKNDNDSSPAINDDSGTEDDKHLSESQETQPADDNTVAFPEQSNDEAQHSPAAEDDSIEKNTQTVTPQPTQETEQSDVRDDNPVSFPETAVTNADSALASLPKNIQDALSAAGLTSAAAVASTSDKELLAIKGIGPKMLDKIRAATQ